MYGRFGKIRAVAGERDALIAHLLRAAQLMNDVDGCYHYVVSSAPDDPDGIWISEVWRSQEDHRASLTHPAVQELIRVGRQLIADMSLSYEVTPLGGKGLSETSA